MPIVGEDSTSNLIGPTFANILLDRVQVTSQIHMPEVQLANLRFEEIVDPMSRHLTYRLKAEMLAHDITTERGSEVVAVDLGVLEPARHVDLLLQWLRPIFKNPSTFIGRWLNDKFYPSFVERTHTQKVVVDYDKTVERRTCPHAPLGQLPPGNRQVCVPWLAGQDQ